MTEFNDAVEAGKRFEHLEPFQLNERTERAIKTTALMSIAISLKRIADKLDRPQPKMSRPKGLLGKAYLPAFIALIFIVIVLVWIVR